MELFAAVIERQIGRQCRQQVEKWPEACGDCACAADNNATETTRRQLNRVCVRAAPSQSVGSICLRIALWSCDCLHKTFSLRQLQLQLQPRKDTNKTVTASCLFLFDQE